MGAEYELKYMAVATCQSSAQKRYPDHWHTLAMATT